MRKENESFQKMTLGGESYLLDRMGICGNLPMFAVNFADIQANNALLKDAIEKQQSSKQSDRLTKAQYRLKLIELCIEIIKKMQAYAGIKKNNELISAINYTESSLIRSTDSELCGICGRILELANSQLADLANYGIDATLTAAMQQYFDDFYAILPKNLISKTEVKENTERLKNIISGLKQSWRTIDSLIEILEKDQPEFYFEYRNIRKLPKTRRTAIDLSVSTLEKQNGQAVSFVKLSLSAADMPEHENSKSPVLILKKTSVNGNCRYKNLADGSYILTASKPGYKDTTVLCNIVSGERRILSIMLERA